MVFIPQGSALERWDAQQTQNLVRRALEPRVPSAYRQPSDETRYLDPKKMEVITRTIFATIWTFATA